MKSFLVSPGAAVTLATGAPAGAGDTVVIDPEHPHNRRLIEARRLIELPAETELTAKQVIEAAGEDPDKARELLDREQERDKPRTTVIKALEAVIDKETS